MMNEAMMGECRWQSRFGASLGLAVTGAMCLVIGAGAGSVSAAPQSAAERNRERYTQDVDIALDGAQPREKRQQAAARAVQHGKDSLGMAWGKMAIEAIRSGRAGGELLVLAAEGAPAPASVDWRPVFEEVKSDPAVGVAILKAMRESPALWPADDWKGVVEKIGVENIPRMSVVVGQIDGRDVTMDFVLAGPGRFMMGFTAENEAAYRSLVNRWGEAFNQKPPALSSVEETIAKWIWVGETEVTQEQYRAISRNETDSSQPSHPVVLSWYESVELCALLSTTATIAFRLPTSAEWEYVCRAGTTTLWSFGDDSSAMPRFAVCDHNMYRKRDTEGATLPMTVWPVRGERQPNAWGVFDMHGNVWEWCNDVTAPPPPSPDPPRKFGARRTGPSAPAAVMRGGCSAMRCDSENRFVRWTFSSHARGGRLGDSTWGGTYPFTPVGHVGVRLFADA